MRAGQLVGLSQAAFRSAPGMSAVNVPTMPAPSKAPATVSDGQWTPRYMRESAIAAAINAAHAKGQARRLGCKRSRTTPKAIADAWTECPEGKAQPEATTRPPAGRGRAYHPFTRVTTSSVASHE